MSELSAFGGPLLAFGLKGTVLLALAWLCAVALRHRSAATRHAVWSAALVGLLLLPAASVMLPAWRAPLASEALGGLAAGGDEDPVRTLEEGTRPGLAVTEPSAEPPDEAAIEERTGADASASVAWRGDDAATRSATVAGAARTAATERSGWTLRAIAVAAWAVGALLVLLLLVLGRLRVERIARRSRPVEPGSRLSEAACRAAARAGLARPPRLAIGARGAMPMTWGAFRPALLLPPEAERWTHARLEAVFLHELAHVRRRDYLTQLLGAVACALHWCNPMAWMALARLRRERELACDDEVLAASSRASGYASELLELVRSRRARPAPPLGALAMARPSQLPDRLRALLDETRVRSRLSRRLMGWTAALGLAVLLPLGALAPAPSAGAATVPDPGTLPGDVITRTVLPAPVDTWTAGPAAISAASGLTPAAGTGAFQEAPPWLPSRPAPCADAESRTRRVNHVDGSWRVSLEAGGCRFEFQLVRGLGPSEGDVDEGSADEPIVFDEGFREIVRMEAGSSLEIRSSEEGEITRRIVMRPREDGRPDVRYWRDGDPAAFDADAAEWLAAALVPVLRITGLQAEARTRYVHRLGGVDGVLWEVDRIGADHVQSLYLLALVDETGLAGDELDRVLETAAEAIGSDATMRRLLVQLVERRPALIEGDGWAAFRRAAGTVGSDAEHRRLLIALLDQPGTDARVAGRLVAAADGEIGSDAEMRRFLISVIERRSGALVEGGIWATAATIGSDAEMRRFLSAVAGSRPDALAGEGFWTAVASIGSDAEMARALLDVTAASDDPRTLGSALDAARSGLGSDADMTRFLLTFADRHREATTGPLRNRYREAAATIGSGRERERALAPLSR